ncbi:acyltransferase [Halomonas dongshanensis]|uniref:Acyltransferase n=1 Tax=Halomonas dongshanensis TaxID=2890835 RepID=A0ABT2EC33_9GAMM|nr:acyltransferase [Halomonas dongshanensis]MCS2609143.1 acyltransferase [Halomonas dongshanensis]
MKLNVLDKADNEREIIDGDLRNIFVKGIFENTCINISEEAWGLLKEGKIKIFLNHIGGVRCIDGFVFNINSGAGVFRVNVGGGAPCYLSLGNKVSGKFDITMYRGSRVSIGDNTTSNGCRIFCDNSHFTTGEDCMISDEVLFQTSDQHQIFNLDNGLVINEKKGGIDLCKHVWIGRRSTLIGKFSVNAGAIVAAGSIVTREVDENSIVAGNPAKKIKSNVSWSRNFGKIDRYIQDLI